MAAKTERRAYGIAERGAGGSTERERIRAGTKSRPLSKVEVRELLGKDAPETCYDEKIVKRAKMRMAMPSSYWRFKLAQAIHNLKVGQLESLAK